MMNEEKAFAVAESEPREAGKRPGGLMRLVASLIAVLCTVAPMGVFAAEGGGGSTDLTTGVTTLVSLVGQVVSLITGNTILMVFLGAALLSAAIGIFIRLFHSVIEVFLMSRYEAFKTAQRHVLVFRRCCCVLESVPCSSASYQVAFTDSSAFTDLAEQGYRKVTEFDSEGVQVYVS